jgi:hypothetical protein
MRKKIVPERPLTRSELICRRQIAGLHPAVREYHPTELSPSDFPDPADPDHPVMGSRSITIAEDVYGRPVPR